MKKILISALSIATLLSSSLLSAADSNLINKLETAAQGEHRSDKNKARNEYRHPADTMAFLA